MVERQRLQGQEITRRREKEGRGNNPRINQRDEIKDPDLLRELKDALCTSVRRRIHRKFLEKIE